MPDENERLVPRPVPSMDDKATPSPAIHSNEEYEAMKARGENMFQGTVKPPVDNILDKEISKPKKKETVVEKAKAELNKLSESSDMTLLNVAGWNGLGRAVERIWERLNQQWLVEKARRDNHAVYAHMHKEHLPDGYWQAEFRARQRVNMALNFLTVIREIQQEEADVAAKYGAQSTVDRPKSEQAGHTSPVGQGDRETTGGSETTPDRSSGRDTPSATGGNEPPQNNDNS